MSTNTTMVSSHGLLSFAYYILNVTSDKPNSPAGSYYLSEYSKTLIWARVTVFIMLRRLVFYEIFSDLILSILGNYRTFQRKSRCVALYS